MDINKITPYHRNPRMNEKTIEPLIESIKKFGFRVPLILDGKKIIVTGHARYKAALQLKGSLTEYLEEIKNNPQLSENLKKVNSGKAPVVIAEDLSKKQAKEFRLADNKIHELSKWNEDYLKFELRELDKAIGFSDEELKTLLESKVDFENYKEGEVEEFKKNMDEKFSELSKDKINKKLKIPCPYCQKEIIINSQELKNLLNSDLNPRELTP